MGITVAGFCFGFVCLLFTLAMKFALPPGSNRVQGKKVGSNLS